MKNKLNRRDFLKLAALTGGVFSVGALGSRLFSTDLSGTRPNIVFIMVDDTLHNSINHTKGRYPVYPSDNNATNFPVYSPNLDFLAKEGIEFTGSHTSTSVCAPARYTALTGRYGGNNYSDIFLASAPLGEEHRIENINIAMELDGMNVQSVLSANGYTTGMVGKWHLDSHKRADLLAAEYGLAGTYQPTDPALDPKTNSANNAKYKNNHDNIYVPMMKKFGWDWAGSVYRANIKEQWHSSANLDGGADSDSVMNVHNSEWTLKGAQDFISANVGNPFFLYYSTTLQHGPAPENANNGYAVANAGYTGEGWMDPDANLPVPKKFVSNPYVDPSDPLDTYANLAAYRSDLENRTQILAGNGKSNAAYTWIDDAVGSLLQHVDDLGLMDNTLFIFTSDHNIRRYGKSTIYDGGMEIPLFMYWKGKIGRANGGEPSWVVPKIVQNIDYAPTFYDLAGVTLPQGYKMDGTSLLPILNGDLTAEIHESLFFEIGWARGVKTKDYKYIAVRYPPDVQEQIDLGIPFIVKNFGPDKDTNPTLSLTYPYLLKNSHLGYYSSQNNPNYFLPDQLYDLTVDPAEDTDLSTDPGEAVKLNEMQSLLQSYLVQFENHPFGEFTKGYVYETPYPTYIGDTEVNPAWGEELTQHDPGGSEPEAANILGRPCTIARKRTANNAHHLYYSALGGHSLQGLTSVDCWITVVYWDGTYELGTTTVDADPLSGIVVKIKTDAGPWQNLGTFDALTTGQWKKITYHVDTAHFTQSLNGGDIRIQKGSPSQDFIIGAVYASTTDPDAAAVMPPAKSQNLRLEEF